MNHSAPQRGQLDAAELNPSSNSNTYDHFASYRSLDRTMFQAGPETSLMNQFKGANDVSIVDGAQDSQNAAGGYDFTAGVDAFEDAKEKNGFTKNEDGSYSLNGESGAKYTIKVDAHTGAITSVVDSSGQAVTDKHTLEQITSTFKDLRQKEAAVKFLEDHPLETDKQKEAADKLYDAMKTGDWKAMEQIAKQFDGNPAEFDAVFYNLYAAKVLSDMDNLNVILFVSKDGNRVFMAGDEKPKVMVPINK